TSATLVIQPENVHMDRAVKDFPSFSLSENWVKPDILGDKSKVLFHTRQKFPRRDQGSPGVMGDPTVASSETGEKVLEASSDDLARMIMEVTQYKE
ncbi:MAG: creatininase family protein, partial [Deltaproteobacteria bacterium]|nr:creatininase family protein [Deltaproteobacteria bacterium]